MSIADTLPPLPVYFDSARQMYWLKNQQRGWMMLNQQNTRLHLKASGISDRKPDSEIVSPMEKRFLEIQTECDVAYAAPVAGYPSGLHEICGNRILVTTSPKFIEPAEGDCSTVTTIIENLFKSEEIDQTPYVYGWLKVAIEALYLGKFRHGQALAIAGPKDCGKSLLQNLFTPIFGGRAAKPYQFMSGQTNFNGDLFTAEHLMIEDEAASTDGRNRRQFGSHIKAITVNDVHQCHPKTGRHSRSNRFGACPSH